MGVFLLKNVFLVINKEKVYAYIVSVVTIIILLFMSTAINNDMLTEDTMAEFEKNNIFNTEEIENLNIQEIKSAIGEAALVSNDNILIENNTK